MIKAFSKQVIYLTEKGFKPVLNIIDNVASKTIRTFLKKEDIKLQLVEAHNHQINAVERAMQTTKDHLIAGLCTTDKDFPVQLWDKIIEQSQDTLNMLRTLRVHPQLSSYTVLEGVHDFNKNLMAPSGTRATIFNLPELRTSWGTRALDGILLQAE